MERHGHLSLSDKTWADLLELSAATADRIFRQFRFDHRPHGKTNCVYSFELKRSVAENKGLTPKVRQASHIGGSDSNGAKSHVKGRSWDRLASQDLSPSVSQGTIWRYVAVDRRLGYA